MTVYVARELRGARLWTGGRGVVFIARGRGGLLSADALAALERAAIRLGYGARRRASTWSAWIAVVRAVDDLALDDVLSEAIEEQESP